MARRRANPAPASVLERVVHAPTRRDPFVILAWVDDAAQRRVGTFDAWGLNLYPGQPRGPQGGEPFDFWMARVQYVGHGAHANYRNVDAAQHLAVQGSRRPDGQLALREGDTALRRLGVAGYARLEQMLARADELRADAR